MFSFPGTLSLLILFEQLAENLQRLWHDQYFQSGQDMPSPGIVFPKNCTLITRHPGT